jgi:hypothetical protein
MAFAIARLASVARVLLWADLVIMLYAPGRGQLHLRKFRKIPANRLQQVARRVYCRDGGCSSRPPASIGQQDNCVAAMTLQVFPEDPAIRPAGDARYLVAGDRR